MEYVDDALINPALIECGSGCGIAWDEWGKVTGIVAWQGKNYCEVKLDRIRLRRFAENIIEALRKVT